MRRPAGPVPCGEHPANSHINRLPVCCSSFNAFPVRAYQGDLWANAKRMSTKKQVVCNNERLIATNTGPHLGRASDIARKASSS